jgi:hypothetical protein
MGVIIIDRRCGIFQSDVNVLPRIDNLIGFEIHPAFTEIIHFGVVKNFRQQIVMPYESLTL